jgi:DNA ligase 1
MLLNSKFFGQPNGTKAPAKQSKLSFSTKPSAKNEPPSSSSTKEDEDVEMDDEDSEAEVKPTVEKGDGITRKRSRTPPPTGADSKNPKLKQEVKTKEEEQEEEEEEDDDDEPVFKRARRNGKTHDEGAASSKSKPSAKAPPEPKKPKATSLPPRSAKQVGDEDVEETSSSKVALKSELNASASEAEAEEEVEEDDEDEKPEIAAEVREKIQTTLKSKAKDPYPDWKPGEPVPYAALCTTFSLIEMTTKRLIMTAHCSLFLRQVLRLTPNDLLPTVLLMVNKLAADYAGIELGIGESLIMKAIGETTGRSLAVIKQDQKEIGDLGLVAIKSRANQPTMFKPKPLTVRGVHKGLVDIATITGSGAQQRKVDGIKKLLSAADGHISGKVDITRDKGGASEAKYIVRFLEGKLRLGLAEKTVLVSLAQAMVCHDVESKGSGKVPSTEKLAEGEAILKAVYR